MISILETILTFIRTHVSTVIFLINIMLSLVIILGSEKARHQHGRGYLW